MTRHSSLLVALSTSFVLACGASPKESANGSGEIAPPTPSEPSAPAAIAEGAGAALPAPNAAACPPQGASMLKDATKLFDPVMPGATADSIGVLGGRVYWRFHKNYAGAASGPVDGSEPASILVAPSDALESPLELAIDMQVVVQTHRGPELILAGETTRRPLTGSPLCAAMTSDDVGVYCLTRETSQKLVAWSLDGVGPRTLRENLAGGWALQAEMGGSYFLAARDPKTPTQSTLLEIPAGGGTLRLLGTMIAPRTRIMLRGGVVTWHEDGPQSPRAVLAPTSGQTKIDLGQAIVLPDGYRPGILWLATKTAGCSRIVRRDAQGHETGGYIVGEPSSLGVDAMHLYWTQVDGSIWRAPLF